MGTLVEAIVAALTIAGMVYMMLALWGARSYVRDIARTVADEAETQGVTILKPLKGVDPRMYAGLASHCRQQYGGPVELVFGVSSLADPAVAEVERLRAAFPAAAIHLVECPEQLGTSGKVSNLVQMLPHATYEHVIINDSDIFVSPGYVRGVMRFFADERVGMVTAPYLGRTGAGGRERTLWRSWKRLASQPTSCPAS